MPPVLLSVALLSPPYATLTYAVPEALATADWLPGLRVLVPLGSMVRVGVVLALLSEREANLPEGVALKAILWPIERVPLLSASYLELVRQLSLRQAMTPGQILGNVLPAGLRSARLRFRLFSRGQTRLFTLRELLDLERDVGRAAEARELAAAWLRDEAEMLAPAEDAAASEHCVLLCDPPWPVRPGAVRQLAVLELLFQERSLSRREVLRRLGQGAAPALAALVRNGQVALRPADDQDEDDPLLLPAGTLDFSLSEEQEAALRALRADLESDTARVHLLFGVTGSGKTAVYLHLARACLDRGQSVCLLAPEVALAGKLRRDVVATLGDRALFFFHGYQSPQTREKLFRELARRSEPCLVVGTRSALFLPVPKLSLIILDEEHDESFKQDEGLVYQAKEIAWFRVMQNRGLLVLGSATPDLKTFHAARCGQMPLSVLSRRAGGGSLPEIRLVDIRKDQEKALAEESLDAIREVVDRGEQAVVMLNRRGYAPLMYCLDCGKVARCPHCDIGLTYHKSLERLTCHYCGYAVPFPSLCPHCRGLHYHPMGQGTERMEELVVSSLPPAARVLRLDRDSTRRPGSAEAILESFARKEAQVLVGTQMLSKGHHFPDVTLAVVADADIGLNLPDYRAAERTFQLLLQSAGRAGRGDKPGRVLIQTRDRQHYCWRFVQAADYEGFYDHEIALREQHRYPPFTRLALLRISYEADWAEGKARLDALGTDLRAASRRLGVTLLGPVPAPLALLRGRRRFHCLIKAGDWQAVRALYAQAAPLAAPPHLRLSLDMDPVNMM